MKPTRRTAVALAIAAATALIPATASAAGRSTAPAACSDHSLRAADHFGLVPTARRAGQKIDIFTPVYNTQAAPRTNVLFYLQLAYAGQGTPHAAPQIWWRIDNGHWKLLSLAFHAGRKNVSSPYWDTKELAMGTFAGHRTRTVEISTSFPAKASKAGYFGYEGFSVPACQPNGQWYQGTSEFEESYQ
ncbi:hypothetical protein [Streptacidiphilus sp. PAMC 29251]